MKSLVKWKLKSTAWCEASDSDEEVEMEGLIKLSQYAAAFMLNKMLTYIYIERDILLVQFNANKLDIDTNAIIYRDIVQYNILLHCVTQFDIHQNCIMWYNVL